MTLTHLDGTGRARMVDVSQKAESQRTAVARGSITMGGAAFELVRGNSGPKGDVLSTAELAGTMGAKRTADLIPLCHLIGLEHVSVSATLAPELPGVVVEAQATAFARTGVEMEVLTAVSVALLTVYDMVKAAGHDMKIGPIRLTEKTGGATGDWSTTKEVENE